MALKKTLYELKHEAIWIKIEVHATHDGQIIVYGHDRGKVVKKIKQNYDYEYYLTIKQEQVQELIARISAIEKTNLTKEQLIDWLVFHFNTDKAVSKIQAQLNEWAITFQFSTW